jgi:protocatechuate 3,4-dioxygenase alpha subunit
MAQKLDYAPETASQTAGPYVHIGLAPKAAGFQGFERDLGGVIAGPQTKGERIRVEGRVLDGTGAALRDAVIEVWQANAQGRYAHPEDRR